MKWICWKRTKLNGIKKQRSLALCLAENEQKRSERKKTPHSDRICVLCGSTRCSHCPSPDNALSLYDKRIQDTYRSYRERERGARGQTNAHQTIHVNAWIGHQRQIDSLHGIPYAFVYIRNGIIKLLLFFFFFGFIPFILDDKMRCGNWLVEHLQTR